MKTLILFFWTLPLLAHADPDRVVKITDPVATVTIKVENYGEPVFSPYLLTLKIKCANGRVKTSLREMSICDYRPHAFNKRTKDLILNYSTILVSRKAQPAECGDHWAHTFNLKRICEE